MASPSPWSLMKRLPVTLSMTAVVVAVFAVELALGARADQSVLFRMGALSATRIVEYQEYWRLITPMVLHNGWVHFVLNTFALVQLAALTELIYGGHRLVGFTFLCGLTGSLASALLNPAYMMGGVGASGALYGLVGLLMTLAITGAEHWREQLARPLRGLVWAVAFGVAIGIAETFFVELFAGVRIIDHWAHAGGFVTGVLLGLAYPEPMVPVKTGEKILAYGATGVLLGAMGVAAVRGGEVLDRLDDELIASIDGKLEARQVPVQQAWILFGGAVLYDDMEVEGADAAFQRQLQDLSPDALWFLHQFLYGQEGLDDETLWTVSRWAELEPDSPEVLNALAWQLVIHPDEAERDPERAVELAGRALELLPEREDLDEEMLETQRAATLDTRAEALFQLDRLQEALTDQQEAVELGEAHDVGEIEAMRERLERIEAALES